MAVPARKIYTPGEYLALDEQSDIRYEYLNGDLVAMSGGTTTHNRIVFNCAKAIDLALTARKRPCSVFLADLRIRIRKANIFTYPDVMVICGKIEYDAGRKDVVINPNVIIEVLSPSTEKYDRTDKFAAYRQIPSLQEYVMVDQSRVQVECFRKTKSKLWTFEAYAELDARLELQALEVEIPLTAIYERVEWEAT